MLDGPARLAGEPTDGFGTKSTLKSGNCHSIPNDRNSGYRI